MEQKRYRNFTVRVHPIAGRPGGYHVQIFGLIPGGQPASDEREAIMYDPTAFVTGGRNLLAAVQFGRMTAQQFYALGSTLANLLLVGSIRKRWWESLHVTRERKQGLRLRLLLEAPELTVLPWEFLYLRPPWDNTDSELYFLALQPDISIVRHENLDIAEPSLTPQASYRLVTAQASPSDLPALALDVEQEAIRTAIAKLPQKDLLKQVWVENTTRRSLRKAMTEPTDILHFSGHGSMAGKYGQIILEREGGSSDPFTAASLASLIQASPLRLAILNACESGARSVANPWSGVASALVRAGVAAVVASQYSILDISAPYLAEEIYLGVFNGLTIDEAVSNARRAIHQEGGMDTADWGAPVLYLRAEEGIIFPSFRAPAGIQPPGQQINIQVSQNFAGPVTGPVTGVSAGAIGSQGATSLAQALPGAASQAIPRIFPPSQEALLLGRDEELRQAEKKLATGGQYYFYGTYGVGKTSLAAELYRRLLGKKTFADGCLWDRVSQLSTENILDRIAGRFAGHQVAQKSGREEKIQALSDVLSGRNDLLIALDEVDDKKIVQALLQAAGNCTLIFNGTKRLNLAGKANEQRLQPLTPGVAEELFKMLARPSSGSAFSEEEAALVVDICKRMRFLPLAVKLAALKYAEGIESLQELRDRLASEPETLLPEDGVVAIFTTHHADLKGMPTALNMLVRIAGFPALEASLKALQVQQADFYSSKDKLVDLGLVDYAGPGRLVLHPLLGSQVKRIEPDAVAAGREWAVRWLMEYAERHRKDYDALEEERFNLLALMDCYVDEGRWDDLISLIQYLFDYLRVRGQWQESFERLDAIVAASDQIAQKWNLAWVLLHRGIIHLLRADYDLAETDFIRADQLFTEENDQIYQGIALYQLARLSSLQGDLHVARNNLEKAIELMNQENSGPAAERSGAFSLLAGIFAIQGDTSQAQHYYDLALGLSEKCAEKEEEARIHLALGTLSRKAGDLSGAQTHFDRASQLSIQLGDLLQLASIKQELGFFFYYQGNYDEAEIAFNEAKATFQQLKYPRGLAQALHALGNIALAHQKLPEAKKQYGEALKINQELGHKAAVAYNQYQLGVVASRESSTDEAEEYYKKALDTVQNENIQDVVLQAAAWFQLSKLALLQKDFDHARKFTERAKELAEQGKHRFTEGAALYQMGLMQAQDGQFEKSRDTMALAHAAFVALNAPEADEVLKNLEAMTAGQGVLDEEHRKTNNGAPDVIMEVCDAVAPDVIMEADDGISGCVIDDL